MKNKKKVLIAGAASLLIMILLAFFLMRLSGREICILDDTPGLEDPQTICGTQ